jgi:hypothetical protein
MNRFGLRAGWPDSDLFRHSGNSSTLGIFKFKLWPNLTSYFFKSFDKIRVGLHFGLFGEPLGDLLTEATGHPAREAAAASQLALGSTSNVLLLSSHPLETLLWEGFHCLI